MDVTLFAFEFPNAEFNAPFSRSETDDSSSESTEQPDSPRSLGPILVTLFVLIGLAVLAKYLQNRRPSGTEPDARAE